MTPDPFAQLAERARRFDVQLSGTVDEQGFKTLHLANLAGRCAVVAEHDKADGPRYSVTIDGFAVKQSGWSVPNVVSVERLTHGVNRALTFLATDHCK